MKFEDLNPDNIQDLSEEETAELLSFDNLKSLPAMRLAGLGEGYVRKLANHIADGYEMDIDEDAMAKAIFDKLSEGPEGMNGIMLLTCLMSAGHAAYHYRLRKKISQSN
jgi:hypothetical protein